jgi:hypothetical protein
VTGVSSNKLDAFKAAFESGGPPYNITRERIEIMHPAIEELRRSGLPERALNVGDLAPAFELTNQDAAPVRSADLLAHGALVIAFSHGHW